MHRIAFAILLVAACEPAVGSGDESVRTELPAPLPTTEVAIPRPDLDGIRLTDRQYREIKFMRGLRENNSVPDLMRQAGALEGIDDTHADQVLQRVLEIDITVVPALIARAELSYRRGRVSAHHSSLAFLDRALELARSTGDVASALRVRCLTHLALGNETASLADEAHLVALAEIDPQVEPAARSLAAELARTGHPERAERLRRRFD